MDKQDNLEEIVDRHYKRLDQLNAATIFIKGMLLYYLFYIIYNFNNIVIIYDYKIMFYFL